MGQTLTHGIYLPDEGERNCYDGLAANWQLLDGAVGTVAEHTTQIAGKAPAVHTHTKADITDFPALANVATSGSYNDLSNIPASFTPASHTHGNITNDGKVGTTANVPLITGTDGVVQAGAFGNQANTFCEGNDSRLSDARTPVAHTHTKSDVTDLLNSNFIPSANNSYDLGSSSYQWNNLYAKNYYYNGVAWGLDKANVWTGNNRFSKNSALSDITSYTDTSMSFTGNSNTIFFNTRGSSNYASFGTFLFAGYMAGSAPDRYGQLKLLRSTDLKGGTNDGYVPDTSFNLWRVAPHYLLMDIMEAVRVQNSGTSNYIAPITTNATELGTSTNKWKTLNGINPGALSLPDNSVYYSFNTDNFVYTGAYNEVTVPKKGWLYLRLVECNQDAYIACSSSTGNVDYPVFSLGTIFNQNTSKYEVNFLMPLSVTTFRLYIYKTQGTLTQHKVFYTEGMIQ